ncbi:hypothetical protein BDA99DRAFT_566573 [Phascolomyces articulosus]|uniref:Uncharacterized protein n=1 Tax=Phascolomyces articulosus TaxID=60185 RepID=A0AAD5P6T9_9FUNG|nr:hypothetical protein BDA99DRAFT_566573 [Phascolomyces articulosus]
MNPAIKYQHLDDEDNFPSSKQPRSCNRSTTTDNESEDELDDDAKLARHKERKGAYQCKNAIELCKYFGYSLVSLPMDLVPLWDEESFSFNEEEEKGKVKKEEEEEEEEEEDKIDWEGPEEPEEYESSSDDNVWSNDDITPTQGDRGYTSRDRWGSSKIGWLINHPSMDKPSGETFHQRDLVGRPGFLGLNRRLEVT